MIVSVIGLGYIGLPTAAVLASKGIKVIGVDINSDIVNTINDGNVHIVEPDLHALVKDSISNGNLTATTKYEKADVFIISVPTPLIEEQKPDINFVKSAAEGIASVLEKGNLIILESTCPVGTSEHIVELMSSLRSDLSFPQNNKENKEIDVNFAYCPERVLPGKIIRELVNNDRIVGGITPDCAMNAKKLYEVFVKGSCFITDSRTAELCKLTENSFRDMNIAFANELSIICDKANIDTWELIELANKHPRVSILEPGPGVGGHCIAIDPWFIINSFPNESHLIQTSRKVNTQKTEYMIEKIKQTVSSTQKTIKDLSIACLGLSFKPNIDDLRESPAMEIADQVIQMGFNKVYLVEPNINEAPDLLKSNDVLLTDLDVAINSAEIIVILVKHKTFYNLKLSLLSDKIVIDAVGLMKLIKGKKGV